MPKSNPVSNLQIVTKCPMCDSSYDKEDIKVINKKDGTLSLHLNCKCCKSSVVMLVILGPSGVTSISIPTDITEEEFEKTEASNVVGYDDVLDMYEFLKEI